MVASWSLSCKARDGELSVQNSDFSPEPHPQAPVRSSFRSRWSRAQILQGGWRDLHKSFFADAEANYYATLGCTASLFLPTKPTWFSPPTNSSSFLFPYLYACFPTTSSLPIASVHPPEPQVHLGIPKMPHGHGSKSNANKIGRWTSQNRTMHYALFKYMPRKRNSWKKSSYPNK